MRNLFHPLTGVYGEQFVGLCFLILFHLALSPKADSDVQMAYN